MSDLTERWEKLTGDYLDWLAKVRNLSPHTVRAYACDLESFGRWCELAGVNPLESNARRLKGYLVYLVKAGYADKTINRHLSALRKVYEWLERHGEVPSAAFSGVPGRKQKRGLPRTMSDDEVDKLISVCDDSTADGLRDAAFIETLYATGARISEIAALEFDDIDTTEGQVCLFGKGSKERIVPLYDRAILSIARYVSRARPELVAKKKAGPPAKALFVSTRGNDMSADALRARFERHVREAGLDVALSPHAVRHTYATELLGGGADLKTVQELLGHESMATTQIYTHLSVDRLKDATRLAHPRA